MGERLSVSEGLAFSAQTGRRGMACMKDDEMIPIDAHGAIPRAYSVTRTFQRVTPLRYNLSNLQTNTMFICLPFHSHLIC